MRYLKPLLAAVTSVMMSGPTQAEVRGEISKIIPLDGSDHNEFGYSAAVSGDTAIVGTWKDDDLGTSSGSAYVYVRDGAEWTLQAKLLPLDGTEFMYFGWSVAIDGDSAIVGMPYDDDLGGLSGSAYVFRRVGETWSQQAKLLAPDGDWTEAFGTSVSIHGDTAIAGSYTDDDNGDSSGSADVFIRDGGIWTHQAQLLAGDGAEIDHFGWAVAVHGDTAVVGAYLDDDFGSASGSAYVFVRAGATWTQQAKLLPDFANNGDYFGRSVAVSGESILVGAERADDNGGLSGAAFVFIRQGVVWTQQAELLPADGSGADHFGCSVSLDGDAAVIGAVQDEDNGQLSGSAYVFLRNGTTWTEGAKLLPSDGAQDDRFGRTVGISGATAVVGAHLDDNDNGTNAGSVYVFDAGAAPCDSDFNGDGETGFNDLLAILAAWGPCAGCPADVDGDGIVGFNDLLILLAAWGPC